jgi:hypothetical protein
MIERLGFDPATLSERRIVLLIVTWSTEQAVADELRALLARVSRGSFAGGF